MGTALDVAGPIRRLLRRGNEHVCGLCRESHGDVVVAWQCLSRCWQAILSRPPVLVRRKRGRTRFRCRYCARDYEFPVPAQKCAAACQAAIGPIVTPSGIATILQTTSASPRRSKQTVHKLPGGRRLFRRNFDDLTKPTAGLEPPLTADSRLNDLTSGSVANHSAQGVKNKGATENNLTEAAVASEPVALKAVAPSSSVANADDANAPAKQLISKQSPSGEPTKAATDSSSAEQPDQATQGLTDGTEKAEEPAAAAEPRKKPKPKKRFTRDGAKYVCTVCLEQYFTRVEVGKCYDGHP